MKSREIQKEISATIAVIFTIFMAGNSHAVEKSVRMVSVGKSKTGSLSHDELQQIVTQMNVLINRNSAGSPQCANFEFRFQGLSVIEELNSINSKDELEAFLKNKSPYQIIVPDDLTVCNGAGGAYEGCSGPGTNIVAVAQGSVKRIAVRWLHEFGHTQFLNWAVNKEEHSCRLGSIMNQFVPQTFTPTHLECRQFNKASARFPFEHLGTSSFLDSDVKMISDQSPLGRLLSLGWQHKPPFEELAKLETQSGRAALRDETTSILRDITQAEVWPNAVIALGFYGDAADVEFLKEFSQRPMERITRDVEAARLRVPRAVAALGLRTFFDSEDGVQFLVDSAKGRGAITEIRLAQNAERDGILRRQFSAEAAAMLPAFVPWSKVASETVEEIIAGGQASQERLGVKADFITRLARNRLDPASLKAQISPPR